DRIVRHRGVRSDRGCEFKGFRLSFAGGDAVVDKSDALGLSGVEAAAGEHHVLDSAESDEAGHPYRGASADEETAFALGQGEIRGLLGHPQMSRSREFEAAADYSALEDGDDGALGFGDRIHRRVPGTRVAEAAYRVAPGHPGEIEPR